ncbi:MAG: 2-C-methyl-D-erythritol 4-phosphate cytidylyltransferase [Streptococcaceae bacterium]|jgi:2-C-methyl-D-erythritol 4-phosphate cytidylyltransferase|nr:2-C-methyl-D-erythritol 4-phosphate cytidylyltransferase [Streptococcaceae bacterium]
MDYEAIILLGGMGSRMRTDRNKVFLKIGERPILLHSILAFLQDENCVHLILVGRTGELEALSSLLPESRKDVTLTTGGKERQDSVYEGLLKVKDLSKKVFIHDGARPFLTETLLRSLKEFMKSERALLLGVPVKDTIKRVGAGENVQETVERTNLWQAQTPQVFDGELILEAHQKAQKQNFQGTDDVSLVEKFCPGVKVKMVMGSYENIKVTTPEDLVIGEAIYKNLS